MEQECQENLPCLCPVPATADLHMTKTPFPEATFPTHIDTFCQGQGELGSKDIKIHFVISAEKRLGWEMEAGLAVQHSHVSADGPAWALALNSPGSLKTPLWR